jgi:hypothetical protein
MRSRRSGRCHAAGWAGLTAACLLLMAGLAASGQSAPAPQPAVYLRCLGWGACLFRLTDGSVADTVRVRLRGVGREDWDGTCPQEGAAARALRVFLEGILARAGRLELRESAREPDGTLRADVWVNGVPITDILIHAGVGRTYRVEPDSGPCD